jgi:hypothetical protein
MDDWSNTIFVDKWHGALQLNNEAANEGKAKREEAARIKALEKEEAARIKALKKEAADEG